jgi:hypothetical protein
MVENESRHEILHFSGIKLRDHLLFCILELWRELSLISSFRTWTAGELEEDTILCTKIYYDVNFQLHKTRRVQWAAVMLSDRRLQGASQRGFNLISYSRETILFHPRSSLSVVKCHAQHQFHLSSALNYCISKSTCLLRLKIPWSHNPVDIFLIDTQFV